MQPRPRWTRALPAALLAATLGVAGDAPEFTTCADWSIEGFRLGMSEREARELGHATGGPSSGHDVHRCTTGSCCKTKKIRRAFGVKDRGGAWKGRVRFKNDRLATLRVTYGDRALDTVVEDLRDLFGDPDPIESSFAFRSKRCDAVITAESTGSKVRLTLERSF
ncbi:MAG: hypothetical protein GY716_02700 [bacterium]|nr:hypothetical protein [bacterium]